ncbi:unnamed protein product [Parascedosporium putredinis]|uniref:Aminotransferase class I/classII large domain-containing protein n=1 Tax=Parascedosporium putredinis TaxID=1442378 RepID=A0A9P1GYQ5_9PEZI|nr:unnamed protein product [Parascedosporium putredinis]CAI7990168.1 unnamed protein product [Parascedosporium putredinis]
MSAPKPNLDGILSDILARREAKSQRRRLTVVPPNCADFSSNAYLSLATRGDIQRDKPPLLGSGGSRLLDGNSDFAENLEREIASFHRAQAGLLFNSGFDANVGLFSCVPQPQDTIVYDELIHASVHDGMRGVGRSARYLLPITKTLASEDEHVRNGARNVFIAVEGVYSMDGDVAPLQEIVECVESLLPHGNGYIIVDEAHSTGIIGERGRGLVCALGLENRVWARLHTFGKAMSCSGPSFYARR